MAKQPRTQRDIKKAKQEKKRSEQRVIVVHNISRQTIPIQLSAPEGVDFYAGEQSITLYRGKSARLPRNRVRMEQLTNLQKSGKLRVEIIDS